MNKNKADGTSFGCKTLQEFSQRVVDVFQPNNFIKKLSTNEQGFIRVWLEDKLVEQEVNELLHGIKYPEVKK